MLKPIVGGCACGAIRYRVGADPLFMVNCHCGACQRSSGSPYATGIIVLTAAVTIEGEPRWYETKADSGSFARRGFCADCGSPLFAESLAPDAIAMSIRAASLDDASWFKPQADMWTSAAQPWTCLDPATRKFETHPTKA